MSRYEYIIIDKYKAAGAQIDTAIELYFCHGDPISIDSLVHCAYTVLRDLSKHLGKEPMLKEFDFVEDEALKKMFITTANAPANFFKHADKDPESMTALNPIATELFLYECCRRYQYLVQSHTIPMTLFRGWYLAMHPEYAEPDTKAETVEKLKAIRESYATEDKQLYYLRNVRFNKYNRALLLLSNSDEIELGLICLMSKGFSKDIADVVINWAEQNS